MRNIDTRPGLTDMIVVSFVITLLLAGASLLLHLAMTEDTWPLLSRVAIAIVGSTLFLFAVWGMLPSRSPSAKEPPSKV